MKSCQCTETWTVTRWSGFQVELGKSRKAQKSPVKVSDTNTICCTETSYTSVRFRLISRPNLISTKCFLMGSIQKLFVRRDWWTICSRLSILIFDFQTCLEISKRLSLVKLKRWNGDLICSSLSRVCDVKKGQALVIEGH